jgi:DNA-binding MarR family transcriptional regulator
MRVHAQDDRRKILVKITPSGAALVSKVKSDMIETILSLMEQLEPAEQKAWLQIYEKVHAFCQHK